jgi:hypothetical protein
MHAAVIHFHTLEVYARSIYSCGMEPEVAKYHLGALALAVADSIASVSASFSPSGPGTAVMVLAAEPRCRSRLLVPAIAISQRSEANTDRRDVHSPHQFGEEDNGRLAHQVISELFAPVARTSTF